MHYTVYKITNSVNGRFYVGVHRTKDLDDGYMGSGSLIKKAVKKYGKAVFVKEILFDFDTVEEMVEKERAIVTRDFVEREETYNLVPGGYQGDAFYAAREEFTSEQMSDWGRSGAEALARREAEDPAFRKYMEGQRARSLAEAQKAPPNPCDWSGRTHSLETREKMSKAARGRTGRRASGYGSAWICKKGDKPRKVPQKDLPRWLSDGWERGRVVRPPKPPRAYAKGERVGSSKLTWEDVQAMRRLHSEGGRTHASLARQFNTSASNVTNILNNKAWRVGPTSHA